MTKKHFIALADDIRIQQKHGGWKFTQSQIEFLANFCKSQNGRFDRSRWLGYIAGDNGPERWQRAEGACVMTNTQSTKHTPGPWSSHEGTSPHYQGQVFDEATGATIAITYSDEDGAHAKLIAQAPAMAEVIRKHLMEVDHATGYDWQDEMRQVLRDAGVLA